MDHWHVKTIERGKLSWQAIVHDSNLDRCHVVCDINDAIGAQRIVDCLNAIDAPPSLFTKTVWL